MRNEYPSEPMNYPYSEPRDYLRTFEGIRQISVEKLEMIKTKRTEKQQSDNANRSIRNKEEDDSLSSFFYTQSFTSWDKE